MKLIDLDKHQLKIVQENIDNYEECTFLKNSDDKYFIIFPFVNLCQHIEHVLFEITFTDDEDIELAEDPIKEFYTEMDLAKFLESLEH